MSPGATFERVYNELKRMLAEGELPPGSPIEPALIGKQIGASITPVRDALHRLTGEQLVEAPNHNGFRAPMFTEVALRDLYRWSEALLVLGGRKMGPAAARGSSVQDAISRARTETIARLFVAIASASGSAEHVRAVEQLNDRLAPVREVESRVLDATGEEHQLLLRHVCEADRSGLFAELKRYHTRRHHAVPAIVAALASRT